MANSKITALTEIGAALLTTDIFPVVDDPAGTPVTMKATFSRILTLVGDNAVTHTAKEGITASTLTIASGAITVTRGWHLVDTEASAASDDLDTISGGVDGMTLVIRAANGARTVVVKDGTGNIKGPGDFSLDNAEDTCSLIYDNAQSAWLVTATSNNGA